MQRVFKNVFKGQVRFCNVAAFAFFRSAFFFFIFLPCSVRIESFFARLLIEEVDVSVAGMATLCIFIQQNNGSQWAYLKSFLWIPHNTLDMKFFLYILGKSVNSSLIL